MKQGRLLILSLMAGLAAHAGERSAVDILDKVVKAGGGQVWLQPQTLQLRGNAVWTPAGNSHDSVRIELNDYALYRVFPSENKAAHAANGKIRLDAGFGAQTFMQLVFDGKNTRQVLHEKARPYQKHFSWSNNFGFGIIRFARREGYTVSRLADDVCDGHPCYVIRIQDPTGMVTWFWIDAARYLIRGMGFQTDIGWHMRVYSDFSRHRPTGFMQPGRLKIYFDGIRWMDIFWKQFQVNDPIPDSVFQQ